MTIQTSTPILRIRITGPREKVRSFLGEHPTEIDSVIFNDGAVSVEAYLDASLQSTLRRQGLQFEVLFDATQRGERLRQPRTAGNRFEGGRIPAGLGIQEQ